MSIITHHIKLSAKIHSYVSKQFTRANKLYLDYMSANEARHERAVSNKYRHAAHG